MAKEYILGVDVGTSSIKAGIFDLDLNVIAESRSAHQYISRGVEVEIRPDALFESLLRALGDLKEYLPGVCAMGFSALCPNMILMDRDGNPLHNGIIHLDRRSEKQGYEIADRFGMENFLAIAGNVPCPGGMSITSLLWLRENAPDAYKKTYKFGHTSTYFIKQLTGKFIIDPSNAGFNGLYDTVQNNGWSKEMCRAFDIDEGILPEVRPSYEIAGYVTKQASDITGIPQGIPVATGGADTACAVLGAGCTKDGQLMNSTGTVEVMVLCTDKPHYSGKYLLRPACNSGHWNVMNIIGAGGESLNWFYNVFCPDMDKDTFFREFLPGLLNAPRTNVFMTPHLAGDRTKIENKSAVISGLTLSTTREDILLGVINGLVGQLSDGMDDFNKMSNLSKTIYFTGGGAQALLDFKKREFPGFNFEMVDNCAMKGISRLTKAALEGKTL
ncbi:MAG: FGGY family carbohydrate kinase [Christensenellales bacterium]|jgi:xylulokinase